MNTDIPATDPDAFLPGGDYRFNMRFRQGDIRQFFGPTAQHDQLLHERRRWLQSAPHTYAAALPESRPLLDETIRLFSDLDIIPQRDSESLIRNMSPLESILALGERVEPDILLLRRNSNGEFALTAADVCFPSSWALSEKIGRPLTEIHGVVPGLNSQLGRQIGTFLDRLRPGISWERSNWGLSRSPELNQHPSLGLPRLGPDVDLQDVWFRVEHQSLVTLPDSGGVLFGIRLIIKPLSALAINRSTAEKLAHHLKTMPPEMAQYKNVATAAPTLIRLLEQT